MLETLLQKGDVVERCGLLLKDGTAVEIENIAKEPENSYIMNPLGVLNFIESGQVEATWHTHPASSPNLSGEDRKGFLSWPDLEHIIIGLIDGQPVAMRYRVVDGAVLACD